MSYNWYGEEYVSVDSFHKIMMTNYSPEGNYAPGASESDKVSFVFAPQEGAPSVIRLTQYANTVDFGSNAFGIKTAAKTYFGITPKELTAEQSAVTGM